VGKFQTASVALREHFSYAFPCGGFMTSGDREGLIELGLKIEGRPDSYEKLLLIFVWQQITKELRAKSQ
jgi:hypothetical protein